MNSREKILCPVCPHRCMLSEGQTGRCRGRGVRNGRVIPLNYGIAVSLALDPIEKKPLNRFYPGSRILSIGSFGCNLSCPFCQNWEISTSDGREYIDLDEMDTNTGSDLIDSQQDNKPAHDRNSVSAENYREHSRNYLSPEKLAGLAEELKVRGNIGAAFTYNEPLIGYEYVLDAAKLLKERGLKTVLVTNGTVNEEIADEVLPFTDALNIDLKSFRPEIYRDFLGGDLETVRHFIRNAAERENCHVELTSLIVPGMNDSEEEMREMCAWIASLPGGRNIPLHVTRFFPRYHLQDRKPTDKRKLLRLCEIAGEILQYVYPGNI